MNLLITGATGFIGSNLLFTALRHPEVKHVIAMTRARSKLENILLKELNELPHHLSIIEADFTTIQHLPSSITHVVHCAGEVFSKDINSYYRVNCVGTQHLFSRSPANICAVILSSQSAVGPTPEGTNASTEQTVPSPISHYGKSKLLMEKALSHTHPHSAFWLLRAPIVLGPRDPAIRPLFKMARSIIRIKPGCSTKYYSWIGINDLINAIFAALGSKNQPKRPTPYFVRSDKTITDHALIQEAASAIAQKGITIKIPNHFIRIIAQIAKWIPSFADAIPSLTPDRAIELYPNRWIVNDTLFRQITQWTPHQTLPQLMREIAAAQNK